MRTKIAVSVFSLIIVALPYAWGKVEHLIPALVLSTVAWAAQFILAPRFMDCAEKKDSTRSFQLLFYLTVIMIGHAVIVGNI